VTLFFILAVSILLAHDTWLYPLLDRLGTVDLTTGNRFPESEIGPPQERIASLSVLADGVHIEPSTLEFHPTTLRVTFDKDPNCVEARLHPHPIELGRETIRGYLEGERAVSLLDGSPLPEVVRERYTKCCKLISGMSDSEVGHPLEIIRAGPDRWTLLREGKPLAGSVIRAYSETGDLVEAISDSTGAIQLELRQDTTWMLRAHHIQRSNEPGFDFESWWCSLVVAQKGRVH
jgi:hypothetical protein